MQFASFYFEFLLVNNEVDLHFNLQLLWFWFDKAQLKTAVEIPWFTIVLKYVTYYWIASSAEDFLFVIIIF